MPSRRTTLALLTCALAIFASGCPKRKAKAAPPVAATVPAPAPAETAQPASPPETKPAPAPVLVVPPPKPAPVNPRPSAPGPTEPAKPKPAPPLMSPSLTPAEEAGYRQKTSAAITAAEKNLQTVRGKRLTVAQRDLEEKVRGFLGQAREAAATGDWVRAHNLAQKAQVLSEELVSTISALVSPSPRA